MEKNEKLDKKYFQQTSQIGTAWLSDFAHHGNVYSKYGPNITDPVICDRIVQFMDRYKIGKSEYGALMDKIGFEKGMFGSYHRLYGHHPIYDFPISNPEAITDFLMHEFSDVFTKNGLPIIPGHLLEDAPNWLNSLAKTTEPCNNWAFINGFDLLAGTVAVYGASGKVRQVFNEEVSVESLGDFARTVGVGAIELAIAMSTANPLLFVGGVLELTAGVKGIFNDCDVIYMTAKQHYLSLEFSFKNTSLENSQRNTSLDTSLKMNSLDTSLNQHGRYSFE